VTPKDAKPDHAASPIVAEQATAPEDPGTSPTGTPTGSKTGRKEKPRPGELDEPAT
jgi:hypothetical protein